MPEPASNEKSTDHQNSADAILLQLPPAEGDVIIDSNEYNAEQLEALGAQALAEPEATKKRRSFKLVIGKLRDTDLDEAAIEIDSSMALHTLMRVRVGLEMDVAFCELRAKRAKLVAVTAAGRLAQVDSFLQAQYKEHVNKYAKPGKKFAELNLAEAGMADVNYRIQLRKLPDAYVYDDAKIINHFTKEALPTDTELGCCEFVPGHWKVNKSEAKRLYGVAVAEQKLEIELATKRAALKPGGNNDELGRLVKEGVKFPGVTVTERGNRAHAKEV